MNGKYRISMIAAVALGLLAAGCSSENVVDPGLVDDVDIAEGGDKIDNTRYDLVLTDGEADVVSAYNRRSVAFLDKLAVDEAENVYTSGLSLNMLLSMFANGVAGEARAELLDYLGANSLSELNGLNSKLMSELVKMDRESALYIANSLWASHGFTFSSSYRELMEESYSGTFYTDIPLSTRQGKDAVNQWCSDKTEGLIPEFLDQPVESPYFSVNALYFKGKWSKEFDKSLTSPGRFTTADGTVVSADFMEAVMDVKTCEKDGTLILEIPFGNGAFEFDVMMPAEGQTIKGLLADTQNLSMLDNVPVDRVRVRLPRLKIENRYDNLVEVIREMGVTKLFSEADFSGMTSADIKKVDVIKQKNVFEIDEEGAEGATVTGGGMTSAVGPGAATVQTVSIDWPFMFIVRETSTGLYVSLGAVNKI
ncbi:MAG: serpin family protein [Bacteroides sp.]|nr:serpin family protein [Bacteroides sp.]